MVRAGMDVEIRGLPGEWLVVGFEGRKVRCVSIDCPGDMQTVAEDRIRPLWREDVNCTPIEALSERRVA